MIPLGIFSMPKAMTVRCWPLRMEAAASIRAAAPLAHPASTSMIGMPVRPRRPSTLCPEATPP